MQGFATEWRRWLAYCGLKAIEESVDTKVQASSTGR